MKNKRPINQQQLRGGGQYIDLQIAFAALDRFAEALADVARPLQRIAHAFHPKPCYCLYPRKVATQLRRRDRRRGVVRKYPPILGGRPRLATYNPVRRPAAGQVYLGWLGAFPHIDPDGSVTWIDPDGVEPAEPIGTIAEEEV